jgi:hypothetical protein
MEQDGSVRQNFAEVSKGEDGNFDDRCDALEGTPNGGEPKKGALRRGTLEGQRVDLGANCTPFAMALEGQRDCF